MHSVAQKDASVKIVTGIALSTMFLFAFSDSMMSVLVNEVAEGFSLSGTSVGMMSSVFNLGTMLALLVAPILQGRVAKMTVLLSATALQAVTLALCGISPVFFLFCASCTVLGVSGGLVDAYTNSLLVDVHGEESTRYLGYLHGLFGMGSLIAPLFIMRTLGWVGWRGAFLVQAVVVLAGLAALRWLGRKTKGTATEQAAQETVLRRRDLVEFARNPRNLVVLITAVFASAAQAGVVSWVLRYMMLRFDAETLGTLSLSLYWVCATINRFSASRIRIAPVRLLVIGAVLAAFCLGAGVLSGSALGMCVAMGGLGLCSGHTMQVLFGECTRGHEGRTTFATSVLIMVMGLTRSVIPLVMAGVSAAVSLVVGMLIPAVASVGVAVFGILLARLDTKLPVQTRAGE